jgi:hypothetical protein
VSVWPLRKKLPKNIQFVRDRDKLGR